METECLDRYCVPLMPEPLVVWSSFDYSDVRSGAARRTSAVLRGRRKCCGVESVGERMQRNLLRDAHVGWALHSAGNDSFSANCDSDSDVHYRRFDGKRDHNRRHASEHFRQALAFHRNGGDGRHAAIYRIGLGHYQYRAGLEALRDRMHRLFLRHNHERRQICGAGNRSVAGDGNCHGNLSRLRLRVRLGDGSDRNSLERDCLGFAFYRPSCQGDDKAVFRHGQGHERYCRNVGDLRDRVFRSSVRRHFFQRPVYSSIGNSKPGAGEDLGNVRRRTGS
jgi:hypothetical protein